MQISLQELLVTFAFSAPFPVFIVAGVKALFDDNAADVDADAEAEEMELELELGVAAASVTMGGAGVVVESGSACCSIELALFVLLFSNLARFNASSRSFASKYQTVMA